MALAYLYSSHVCCGQPPPPHPGAIFSWYFELVQTLLQGLPSGRRMDFTKLFLVVLLHVSLARLFNFRIVVVAIGHNFVPLRMGNRYAISFEGPHGTIRLWFGELFNFKILYHYDAYCKHTPK